MTSESRRAHPELSRTLPLSGTHNGSPGGPAGAFGLVFRSAEIQPNGLVKDWPRPYPTVLLPCAGCLQGGPLPCPLSTPLREHQGRDHLPPVGSRASLVLSSSWSFPASCRPLHYLPRTKQLCVGCLGHSLLGRSSLAGPGGTPTERLVPPLWGK